MNTLDQEIILIEQESQEKINKLKWKKRVFEEISSNPVKETPAEICPNPFSWNITLPQRYQEGEMIYSVSDFKKFENIIEQANKNVDKLIQVYEGFVKKFLEKKLEEYGSSISFRWNPIQVKWDTYALPHFLDNPLLGKHFYAELNFYRINDILDHSSHTGFRIVHDSKQGIVPLFVHNSGEINNGIADILKEINKWNPQEYRGSLGPSEHHSPHLIHESLKNFKQT
jgi:hypothetical protein